MPRNRAPHTGENREVNDAARSGTTLLMDVPRATHRPFARRHWKLIVSGSATLVVAVLLLTSRTAVPAIDRSSVWIDTVRQGTMLREVRGSGTLVSEAVRWVPSLTSGRVEQILVRPGQSVSANTTLLVLSNPDVQLEALTAQQQLTASEASLVTLRSAMEAQRLSQVGSVAQLRSEARQAAREAGVARALGAKGLGSVMETERAVDRETELAARRSVEEERLRVIVASAAEQLALQQRQVAHLRAIAAFHLERVRSLRVAAGADGIVQDLLLQPGQWVNAGTQLARVAGPGRLKAVLRVPATDGRDVAVGQGARIDTHDGVTNGTVARVDPSVRDGTVDVEIALDQQPTRSRADLPVDGVIEIERIARALYVGRIANVQAAGRVEVWRVAANGTATRVPVRVGRLSASSVEILAGLTAGDRVITSDLSRLGSATFLRLR